MKRFSVPLLTTDTFMSDVSTVLDASISYQDTEQARYRSLWAAVLIRLIEDASSGVTTKYQTRYFEEAVHFLLHNNKDFFVVCDLAGFDAQAVRDKLSTFLLA